MFCFLDHLQIQDLIVFNNVIYNILILVQIKIAIISLILFEKITQ